MLTSVTLAPKSADLQVFLGGELVVLHVSQMILGLQVIPVDVGEVVLWELKGYGEEDIQLVQNLGVQAL